MLQAFVTEKVVALRIGTLLHPDRKPLDLVFNYTQLAAEVPRFTKIIEMRKKCFQLNTKSLRIGAYDNCSPLIAASFLFRNFNIFIAEVLLFLKN